MVKAVVVRTHGGLGNQLFQIFQALCCVELAGGAALKIVHDRNYAHSFEIDPNLLALGDNLSTWERFISACRIPKICKKVFKIKCERMRIGKTLFLDGYFQDSGCLVNVPDHVLRGGVRCLREAFNVSTAQTEGHANLRHIRLGDFFESLEEERSAAVEIIESIKIPCDIITNRESIVSELIQDRAPHLPAITLVSTRNMSSSALMKLMGRYEAIASNNSTIAVWSSILYQKHLDINHEGLSSTMNLIRSSEVVQHR